VGRRIHLRDPLLPHPDTQQLKKGQLMTATLVYTKPAIALHWLIALLIFGAFPLGIYLEDLPLSPSKLQILSWHKWIGVTVLLLAAARAAWRVTHEIPAPPAGMPAWQVRVASITHGLLYALLFVAPVSGWLLSSAKGFQTVYFGILPLPDLVMKSKELSEVLQKVHGASTFIMMLLIIAHVAAALKHHLVDRDDVMKRMLPGYKK